MSAVSSRERVLCALAHQAPDRVPCDFWAEPPTWNRLFAYRSYTDKERLLRELGVDLRRLEIAGPPEQTVAQGIYQNFWGERYISRQTRWGPMREDVKGALAHAGSLAELEAFAWPTPDAFNYSGLKEQCQQYQEFALVYGFADVWQRPALVRGWEGFFIDMVEHPDWVHFLCQKFTDFYLEDYSRAANITQGQIDLYLLISDLGSQKGPLISLPMFHTFVAPYLKQMIDHIHRLDGWVLFHSCGHIGTFIPELIKLGVDVLDPIQPVSSELAPERLKAEFGDRLSFHGGIDMQHLLPSGSPEQIRKEVKRYCNILGEGGGYILSPAHLFQPDVPPENILAVYSRE